jgi:transposase InsO family protein
MDAQIKRRLQWIKLYEATGDAGFVCHRCGISRPALRKRLKRYQEEGEPGLRDHSRRPKTSPQKKVTREYEQWILDLRRTRNLGVRRIQNELKRLHHLQLGLETIHKILCKHHVPALQQPVRQQKPKRYQKAIPGERVQMDTCKIAPGLYQYTAVDDCTRYLVVCLYSRRTAANAVHFLTEDVIEEMLFPIQRLQTDNGREFTAYTFQDTLTDYSIKFRPIRPASPHLNRKVERAQKTVLAEFYALVDWSVMLLASLNDELGVWQHHYNWERVHGGIGQSPVDKLHVLRQQTPFWDEVIERYDVSSEEERARQRQLKKRPQK